MRIHPLVLILGLLWNSPVAAQTSPHTTIRLADGVYAVTRQTPRDGASDSNVLFIVNEQDVIVVDANILPTSAREVIAEIRKVTQHPVRYVINTHWHADHHFGNQAYRDAFPGVEFVQHTNTRADAIARELPGLQRNVEVEYPAVVARLDRALETGRTSTGVTVTDSMRQEFTYARSLYQLFIDDMSKAPMVPGTLTVTDSLVFHRGERTIVVKYLGKGNTAGDLVVYLPRERIVATGDLVVHPTPFAFFSHVAEWPGTLRALRTIDAGIILPGHGEVQRDWGYVDRLIALLDETAAQVRAAVASGADLAATLERVRLESHRAHFGSDTAAFDRLYRRPAIEGAFRALAATTRSPQYFNPTWSPDGKTLVYESDSSGRYAVYRVSASGGQPAPLVSSAADDMQGSLSPDGRSLAFVSNRTGNLDVFVMRLDGGEVKQLTTDPGEQYQPRWSPDGHSLAFVSKPGKSARIHDVMLLDLASGVIRNLTNTPDANELGPAWKPDGHTLVFSSNRAGGGMVLYELDLSSGAVRNTAIQGPASSPHVSPNGATTFVSNRDGNAEVYVALPDGERIVRVTEEAAEDWGPTLSPDGRQVAFASKRGGHWGIYIADATGENIRCVVGHCATR